MKKLILLLAAFVIAFVGYRSYKHSHPALPTNNLTNPTSQLLAPSGQSVQDARNALQKTQNLENKVNSNTSRPNR